jgi:Synaptobrevin/Regulated-SNARE-like domain
MDLVPGKRYISQGDIQTIHYTADSQGRVYSIVTNPNYPARVAFTALDELVKEFADFSPKVPTASEESLSASTRLTLKAIADKFGNPATVDKLTEVQGKIDVATSVMKENIQQILLNEEKIERIEAASEQLNEKAIQFQSQSKQLTDKM